MSTSDKATIETKERVIFGALSAEQLEYIFKEVINDRGGHGDFLKAFATAFVRADIDNRALLYHSAMELVLKYRLTALLPATGDLSCGHGE